MMQASQHEAGGRKSKMTPDPEFILRGCNGPVTSLLFHKDMLLSGTQEGTLYSWDMKLHRPRHKFLAHDSCSVLWLHALDDDHILSQGRDGRIHHWQIGEGHWHDIGAINTASLGFSPSALLQNGNTQMIATASGDTSEVSIVDLSTKEEICKLLPKESNNSYGMCMDIKSLTSTEDCSQLLVGYEKGCVALWDIKMQKPLSQLELYSDSVMTLDYHRSTNRGVCASVTDTLSLFSIDGSDVLQKTKEIEVTNPGVNCVRYRADGTLFATAGWDSQARLFSSRGKALAVLSYHTASAQSLAFAPDCTLAVGSKDTMISIWCLYQ